jgi:nitrogen fixation NifU-like protein
MSIDQLYPRLIRKHARQPRNKRPCPECTLRARDDNPMCGDEVEVALELRDGTIRQATFQGQGCAISQASASMMTEAVTGLSLGAALALEETLRALLRGMPSHEDLGDLMALAATAQYPGRMRCAALPWLALKRALGRAIAGG